MMTFRPTHECCGRAWFGWRFRLWADFCCWALGHNLWRVMGSTHDDPNGSLPLYATLCLRCGKGGYVEGDYRP